MQKKNTVDDCDLSHPIGDLKKQISHRPTWERYSKGFFMHFTISGSRVLPVFFILPKTASNRFRNKKQISHYIL